MIFQEFFLPEIHEALRLKKTVKREFYNGGKKIWIFHDSEYEISKIIFFSFLEKEMWVEYARDVSGTAYRVIPEEEPEGIAIFQARLGSRLSVFLDADKLRSEIFEVENEDLRKLLAGLPGKNLSGGVFLPTAYVHSLLKYQKSEAFRKYSASIKDPNAGFKKPRDSRESQTGSAPGNKSEFWAKSEENVPPADNQDDEVQSDEGEVSPSENRNEDSFEGKARRAREAKALTGKSDFSLKDQNPEGDNSFEARAKRAKELREATEKLDKLAKKFRL